MMASDQEHYSQVVHHANVNASVSYVARKAGLSYQETGRLLELALKNGDLKAGDYAGRRLTDYVDEQIAAKDTLIAELQAEVEALRAVAAPVPLRKPTVAQVTDAIGYHASAWDCVDPRELIDAILMLAAAPQPPEAAPVELPEYGIDTANHAGIRVRGYTEQQVRELLAAHGIGKDKA